MFFAAPVRIEQIGGGTVPSLGTVDYTTTGQSGRRRARSDLRLRYG
jgi:hypothetical protein